MCVKLEASPQAKASKSATRPLGQDVWARFSWPPLPCSLLLLRSPLSPLERHVSTTTVQGLRSKSRRLLKLAVWGACLSGPGLNSWECLMWGSSSSLHREKLWILSFLLPVCRHAQGGGRLSQDMVSAFPTGFHGRFYLFIIWGRHCEASGIFVP